MPNTAHMDKQNNSRVLLLGNEALVRGALEAGLNFAAGYPGTPSSEIIENLAKYSADLNLHVEWSTNEKVAAEGAAAAAIAGLCTMGAMKNAGLSVALDFLTHLSLTGLGDEGGSMVVVVCDDPDAHSSGDETDSRWLAEFAYAPLLEPSSVQEARDAIRMAYDISERFKCYVMVRSYTRLSHASSIVELGEVTRSNRKAHSNAQTCLTPYLGKLKHEAVLKKLAAIQEEFEHSHFNEYVGPENPQLIIVASGSGVASATEAVELLGLEKSVGILKLVTLWPFPKKLVQNRLSNIPKILVVEEVDPFVETHVKEALFENDHQSQKVYGKLSDHVPGYGEIGPDRVVDALSRILGLTYQPTPSNYAKALSDAVDKMLISRGLIWCPGCPHRATFWALKKALKSDKREVYVTGDIGCYTLDVFPEGKCQMNLLHAMGSGIGLAAGLGQLGRFGHEQPIVSICGDSTFFHASIPGLINAVYNGSNLLHIVLDNEATAMTGFQAHPGVGYNAVGASTVKVDIAGLCRSLGTKVTVADPFDLQRTTKKLRELLNVEGGVRILIMKRACELLRAKRDKAKPYRVKVNEEKCKGMKCRICFSDFRCPALVQDQETGKSTIREDACPGCGACVNVCPSKAIIREETSS